MSEPSCEASGIPPNGILRSDLRKLQRGLHHAVKAFAGEIAGVGAGRALAIKDTDADGSRSGFFEGFDLAKADERGEFVAFADYAFGSGCATAHGAADDVLGEVAEVGFEFRVSGF